MDRHDGDVGCPRTVRSMAVNGADQERMGREEMMKWKRELEGYAKNLDGLFDYVYMNYADSSQTWSQDTGRESICKMWAVSNRCDPAGALQSRQPGGFKLPLEASC